MATIPDSATAIFKDTVKSARFAAKLERERNDPVDDADYVMVRPGTAAGEVVVIGSRNRVMAIIGILAEMGHHTLMSFSLHPS